MISRKQYEDWKDNPVTVEIFKDINSIINEIRNDIANFGLYSIDDPQSTHLQMTKALYEIRGLSRILEIEFVDPHEEENA